MAGMGRPQALVFFFNMKPRLEPEIHQIYYFIENRLNNVF
jgi:hypothetical protein